MKMVISGYLLSEKYLPFSGAKNCTEKSSQSVFEDLKRARTFQLEDVPVIA